MRKLLILAFLAWISVTGYFLTTDFLSAQIGGGTGIHGVGRNLILNTITGDGHNIRVSLDSNDALLLGNKTAVGSFTAGSSTGNTVITKAAHGVSTTTSVLLVHITASSVPGDLGYYRSTAFTMSALTVERSLVASSGIAVTVYKDMVGFFNTDGTNGNRIMGYSAQDKPLQIGGDVLAATGHSLGAEDVLNGGKLEVNGNAYFDSVVDFASTERLMYFVGGTGGSFDYEIDDGLHLSAGNSDNGGNRNLIITEYAYRANDYDHDTLSVNPTLIIHSALDPDISNNQWGSFNHDQEDFIITTGVTMGTGSAPTTDENGVKIFPRGGTAGIHIMGNGLVTYKTQTGIVASTTQTQGQQPLTAQINVIATCANSSDVVTMPTASTGLRVIIINNGRTVLQVFAASGDDIGSGVNSSTTVATSTNKEYVAYDATNWETL